MLLAIRPSRLCLLLYLAASRSSCFKSLRDVSDRPLPSSPPRLIRLLPSALPPPILASFSLPSSAPFPPHLLVVYDYPARLSLCSNVLKAHERLK